MAMEQTMELTNQLLVQAQALSALIAFLRTQDDVDSVDPVLHSHLGQVVDALNVRSALATLSNRERNVVIAFARSYLHQAVELMDDPGRPNAWSHSDPTILQAQGAASAMVATIMAEAKLAGPGARVLDVGTGVGRLAIAFCQEFDGATVVGLDPWEPALALARMNVSDAALEERITLKDTPIQHFTDGEGFDLIWLPTFFLPDAVLDQTFKVCRDLLRPEGSLVAGVIERPEDELAAAVDALITVRSGGAVLTSDEATQRLRAAGFIHVEEVNRTWKAPLRLVQARNGRSG